MGASDNKKEPIAVCFGLNVRAVECREHAARLPRGGSLKGYGWAVSFNPGNSKGRVPLYSVVKGDTPHMITVPYPPYHIKAADARSGDKAAHLTRGSPAPVSAVTQATEDALTDEKRRGGRPTIAAPLYLAAVARLPPDST